MKFFGLFTAFLLISSQAFAADDLHLAGRFGLGVGGGVPIPINYSTFRNTDTGWMAEGHGDYYFTDGFGIEAQYQHLNYQGGEPLNNTYLIGFNWRWIPTAHFTPVLGIGAGWGTSTAKIGLDSDYNNWYANGKAGLDYAAGDNFIIELAAHYSWLFSKNDGSRDQQAIVPEMNFTWFFGQSTAKAEPMATATPAPTPAPVPVDGDDDGDGVPNSKDRCPNTPKGTKVNSFGCALEEAVNEKIDIEFQTGKSIIPADYTTEVDKIVTLMTEHTDVNAEIQGYTDNVGGKAKNQRLSEARANSVRNYLIKHGIDKARVTAKGYGETKPVADNSTAEGRKENRRVVASLMSKIPNYEH